MPPTMLFIFHWNTIRMSKNRKTVPKRIPTYSMIPGDAIKNGMKGESFLY